MVEVTLSRAGLAVAATGLIPELALVAGAVFVATKIVDRVTMGVPPTSTFMCRREPRAVFKAPRSG